MKKPKMNRGLELSLVIVTFLLTVTSQADPITSGTTVADAIETMEEEGYSRTALSMISGDPNNYLAFWLVGKGVMVAESSISTKKIVGVSYCLFGVNDVRELTTLEVKSFDPESGEMVIQTQKLKKADSGVKNP